MTELADFPLSGPRQHPDALGAADVVAGTAHYKL